MIRRLLSLFFLLVSTDAWATTRWVSPTGDGGVYTFATPGGLDSAKIVSVAGDVIRLKPGTYSIEPDPSNNGASSASRIQFYGNPSYPDSFVFTVALDSYRQNVTWNGMRFNSSFNLSKLNTGQYARGDSVLNCVVMGSIQTREVKHNKFKNISMPATTGTFSNGLSDAPWTETIVANRDSHVVNEGNRFSRMTMSLGSGVLDGYPIVRWKYCQSDTMDSSTIVIELDEHQTGEVDAFIMHYGWRCRMFDNHWTVTNNYDRRRLFRMRDSTRHCTWVRDTLDFLGETLTFYANSSGDGGRSGQNKIEACVFKNDTPWYDQYAAVSYQDFMQADTLYNSSICSMHLPCIQTVGVDTASSTYTTTLIDHNTMVGGTGSANGGFGGSTFFNNENGWTPPAVLKVTNNIIMTRAFESKRSALGVLFTNNANQLTINNNLYWKPDGVVGDAINWKKPGSGKNYSPPGTGFSGYKPGQDAGSIWDDPELGGYDYSNFDPTLASTSPARSAGTGGTNIGSGLDIIRPYVVSASIGGVRDNEITLAWVSTGDDSLSGTVASYDIRYSTSTIDDEAEWAAATQISGEPTPQVAGVTQTHRVTGLTNGTFYYFVIRATDDAGNQSALSDNVCAYPPYFCAD